MAAITRGGFGIEQALAYRYRILPLLALCMLWKEAYAADLFGIRTHRARKLATIGAAMLLFAGAIPLQNILAQQRAGLVDGLRKYRDGGITDLAYPDSEKAAAILRVAIRTGNYCP
jgi:hypothetical protein